MLKRFTRSRSGAVATMTALLFPVLLGVAGLGIELGFWYTVKRSMQGAADGAAYEAALTFFNGGDAPAVYTAHAQAVAGQNGWQNGVGGVTVAVNKPPLNGSHVGDDAAIEVIISRPQSTFMAWIVGYTAQTTIAAHAVMSLTANAGNNCILGLSSSSSAISIQGNGSISAPNCGVASDGNVNFSGNHATLTAQSVAVTAGSAPCPSSQCTITTTPPQVNTHTTTPDPYHGRSFTTPPATPAAPTPCPAFTTTAAVYCGGATSSGSLGFASDTIFVGQMSVSGGNVTFGGGAGAVCPASPSVVYFSGGLSLSGNANVTLCPGIYYIEGGSFSVTGNGASHLTGTHVTIILTTDPANTNYATANVAGQGTVTLSAPTDSTSITLPGGGTAVENTAGLVFFQDRNAPVSAASGISVGGNGTVNLTGAVYSPTETVTIAGNGTSVNTGCTQVVAQFVIATGNGAFGNGCTGDGTTNFGSGGTTALVE